MSALPQLPALTRDQMAEVDRLMLDEYGVDLLQMMEHAGLNTARLACMRFLGNPGVQRVTVLAGTGGNGGGALAAARMLSNRGADVNCISAAPGERLTSATRHQINILGRMGLAVSEARNAPDPGPAPDLIIDGLIGYSLNGAPRAPVADLIRWANESDAPVLALDLPSGIDATTGEVYDPAVRADATLTLAMPKAGLFTAGAQEHVGELYLADIGVPPALYERLDIDKPPPAIFANDTVVRLR